MEFRRPGEYEPVTRTRGSQSATPESWSPAQGDQLWTKSEKTLPEGSSSTVLENTAVETTNETWSTRRGHVLTFAALFLYTAIALFRPYELSPALAWTITLPYWMAIGMLVIFIPSQFVAEGSLTARPREIKLVLALGLIAILSIPQAIDPQLAWDEFYSVFMKTVIVFVVMVNALRTERRLRAMMLLSLVAGGSMSVTALLDYSAGRTGAYVDRATVAISNMFGEPNSLAMHLVIMIPIALALFLSTSNIFKKVLYLATCLIMIAGVFATFSRGGFLGLVAVGFVLAWKLGRKNRLAVVGLVLIAAIAATFLAPGGYGERVASIINPAGEASASARQALLSRSLWVGITSPFLGVGIGNLRVVLIHDQVSHNAYTQIAGDLGLIALTLYLLILIFPYKRLAAIERETLKQEHHSRYYYLAVGLQASLIGYMVSSFFLSVAYDWYVYFLVAYAVCFRRLYETRPLSSYDALELNGSQRTDDLRITQPGHCQEVQAY